MLADRPPDSSTPALLADKAADPERRQIRQARSFRSIHLISGSSGSTQASPSVI